jgi:hypothetical protein
MKRTLLVIVLAAAALAGACIYQVPGGIGTPETYPPDNPPVQEPVYDSGQDYYGDTSDFYAYLGPMGFWVSYAPYGNVWVPRGVDRFWRPYTRGHWIYTDDGWTWMSGERWGWLVYHYGRWGWDPRLGWYWVPGNVWGPAWVAWRWGDMYVGWAPLPPAYDFRPGRGWGRRDFDIPGHYWSFIRGRNFMDRSLDRWIIPPERNLTIINYTQLNVNIHERGNHVINDGIDPAHVQRFTNRPVDRLTLKDAGRPDREGVEARDALVYRPQIKEAPPSKPREVLDRDRAADRIAMDRPVTPLPKTAPPEEPATRLRLVHEREQELLKESQDADLNEIKRKADTEKSGLRRPADKQKVDAETQAKVAELRKKHAAEKAALAERQKGEEKKTVKKVPLKAPVKPKEPEKKEKY